MNNYSRLLICFLLATALFLVPNICTAYADDTVEIIDYGGIVGKFYDNDPQKMPQTKYPDLEQAGQFIMKIWGGPYLAVDDQICFSVVNTSDDRIELATDYDLEVEINGQWYLLYRETSSLAYGVGLAPGENWTNSVREDIHQKLHPGKYRIVVSYPDYAEFEILEPGSNLSQKPTSYDWQFLNRYYHEKEPDRLDIIKFENQPITTVDEYLNFAIDIETDNTIYWQRLNFETKIDGQWRLLAIYEPGYNIGAGNLKQYYAYYPMSSFLEPVELTLEKVSIPSVWAPAGPFAGEHRIWGELVVDERTTEYSDGSKITEFEITHVYGEFEIVDATEASINTASAWAQNTIQNAITAGLVPQNLQVKFQQPITRAEFVALALAFLEAKSGSSTDELLNKKNIVAEKEVFNDTNDERILAAYALGIISGNGDGTFDPDGNITREQMAVMLMRVEAVLGGDILAFIAADYVDRNQFSTWAIPGIDYVTEQTIMGGVGNNRFDPKSDCTREQVIITFYRMFETKGK